MTDAESHSRIWRTLDSPLVAVVAGVGCILAALGEWYVIGVDAPMWAFQLKLGIGISALAWASWRLVFREAFVDV